MRNVPDAAVVVRAAVAVAAATARTAAIEKRSSRLTKTLLSGGGERGT
jgi:hypothetical protein